MSSREELVSKQHSDANRIVPREGQRITVDKLKSMLPHKTSVRVTEEIVDIVNNMENDTGLPQELLEEDLMSYMHVIGNVKGTGIKELINAIKFCNLKRNYDNKEAWAIVFPAKYDRLVNEHKQIDPHVSMYNGSKLVVAIDKEMLIPVSLQYAPYFHAAVRKQFEIMNGKASDTTDGKKQNVSPMVQHLAAKELAVLTKPLEETKISVSVNPSEVALSAQSEMNAQLKELVAMQKQKLDAGYDIIDVQQIGINFDSIGSSAK